MAFDLDGASAEATSSAAGGRKQGTKRKKYTARACHQCKRRKVKCSGEIACQQCRSRDVRCHYSPAPSAPGGQSTQSTRTLRWEDDPPTNRSSLAPAPPQFTEVSCSPWVAAGPTGSSDPRVDGLCDRMKLLERTLAHLLESAKASEDLSPQPTRPRAVEEYEDQDANQFVTRATVYDDLSLSSQVAAMRALLSRPPSPKQGSGKSSNRSEILLELPDPPSLQHGLDVYFRHFDCYFPFLDQEVTRSRIYNVIRRLGYTSYNRILVVTIDDLSTVALACFMLAMAECVDPGEGACDGDMKPGLDKYVQGRRAMQRLSNSKTLDLDVVRAQCLTAAYLLHNEELSTASQAVSVAWHLAMSIRLHDKKAWPPEDTADHLQRQRLWWTIYFLDRQISRRSGIVYHIRDTEFDVDDFTISKDVMGFDPVTQADPSWSTSSIYIQALINLARLWGHVWDTFFAVGATKKGDWMEIEIMDARILNTRRQLPAILTWDSDDLANYTLNGEDEPHIRRRLQIYTRLSLLRMLIRQNPVRRVTSNSETAHVCSRLSREIINAHDLFITRFPGARACGYFSTSSVVECIYHLAPVLHYSEDDKERTACISAFDQAHSILVRLSAYNNVAKRALKALNGVTRKWGQGYTAGSSNGNEVHNGVTDYSAMQNSLQPQRINRQFAADGFGVDLGEWMDMSMGSLFSNEIGCRLET